jgi:hypothetical protein
MLSCKAKPRSARFSELAGHADYATLHKMQNPQVKLSGPMSSTHWTNPQGPIKFLQKMPRSTMALGHSPL